MWAGASQEPSQPAVIQSNYPDFHAASRTPQHLKASLNSDLDSTRRPCVVFYLFYLMLNVIRKKECVCCVKVREGRDKCGSGKCHQVYNITKTQGRQNYSPAAGALCTFNRYLFLFSEWIIMISISRSGWRIGAPLTLACLLDGRVTEVLHVLRL